MPHLSQRKEAAAIFGIAVLGWAFPGVFVRIMPHLSPFPLVAFRLGMAWIVLTPIILRPSLRSSVFAALKNWRAWLVSLGMLIYYLVATPAFLYAPVGEVALVIASAPLFAVILRWISRQPVTRLEVFGAFLAISGVLVMALPSFGAKTHTYEHEWIGVVLAVMAALAAAVYAIGNRHLVQIRQSPGALVQVWLTFTLGLCLAPSLVTVPHPVFSQPNLLWLIPLGAFSTAMPTVAVAASSHRLSSVAATMINPLCSVAASIVAAIVIHETPSVWMVLGGGLVLAAVFTASRETPVKVEGEDAVLEGASVEV